MTPLGSPFRADRPLTAVHDEPWADVLAQIGDGHHIRGMFVAPIFALLPTDARAEVLASLRAPPRAGVFVPFVTYSRRDYLAIVLAVAARSDPALALPERIRRIARNDFETFSESVLGLAVRAAVGNARAALLRTPQVYDTVAAADDGAVVGGALPDGRVELRFERYPIFWPYQLGQIEGIARSFGDSTEVEVDVDADARVVRYVVRVIGAPR